MSTAASPRPDAGELIEFLRAQRQTRRLRPDPIPEEALRDILEVARWTGSAVNKQPWEFVVVRDRATLQALAEAYPNMRHIGNAAAAIILVMAGEWSGEMYDEGRLTERILLAASAHGLAAAVGWLGLDGTGVEAKRLLGIPAERTVRTSISLGYPAPEAATRRATVAQPRKPLAELAHAERYGAGWG